MSSGFLEQRDELFCKLFREAFFLFFIRRPICDLMPHSELMLLTMEEVGLGFATFDKDECIEVVNATMARMFGYPAEDLRRQNWRLLIHPDDHATVAEAFAHARNHTSARVEVVGLRRGGGVIASLSLRIRAVRMQAIAFQCLAQDFSSERQSHEQLTLAVEVAPSGLLILDPSGTILMANKAVESMFHYDRADLIGNQVEILLPQSLRTLHRQHRDELSSEIRAMRGRDLLGRRGDGVEIPVQVFLNVVDRPEGKLILCTIIDLTERVRHEQQLEEARKAAEAASQAKSDFLARMSHEIRTPINLIMGMSALLLETQLTHTQREYLEISYRNLRRLLRLINEILDISKVESGMLHLEKKPFDLAGIVSDCAATISSAAERKGLLLSTSILPDAWLYWSGDGERIQQILLNVMSNAVKFTDQGSVDVRVSHAVDKSGCPGIHFAVSDTGCGIQEEDKGRVFDAFHQVDGRMNRKHEGSGLGLAISRTLVQMMGGDIWFGKHDGPGVTMEFTVFPERVDRVERPGEIQGSQASLRDLARSMAPARILIADDNKENLLLLQAFLQGLPFELDFAADGREAVEKARAGDYDLILMDIQMPVLDGYGATREIRKWEWESRSGKRIPIVTLSAHGQPIAAELGRSAGCDGHVTKPVERQELIQAIARFARRIPDPGTSPPPPAVAGSAQPPLDEGFIVRRKNDVVRIRQAQHEGDLATIIRIAHDCKGFSKGYGFPDIGLAAGEMEAAAQAGNASALEAGISRFCAAVQTGAINSSV